MVIETQFISAETFWEIANQPENADKLLELIEGIMVEMPRPGGLHGKTVTKIARYLDAFVEANDLGDVTVETGYILFINPDGKDTVLGPDVGFIRRERIPEGVDSSWVPFPPDLAVEVISPNDKAGEISEKIKAYLRAGTQMVLMVDSILQTVIVHQPNKSPMIYDINGVFDGGAVLPGFNLPIRDIFPK